MAKRFIDIGRHRQAWRKLDSKAFRAFYYMWDQADAAGVYTIDRDQFKLDNGYAFADAFIDALNAGTGACKKMTRERILLVDFIADNYTAMKEGYNPHKPAFRALEKNGLLLNSSLNQASSKLEDEDEGEEEDEGEKGRGPGKPAPVIVPHEPQNEAERIIRSKANDMPFASDAFSLAFADFTDMRVKMRKPMTPAARRMILSKCEQFGEAGAITSLRASTVSGWTDVYPPKDRPTATDLRKSTITDRNTPIELGPNQKQPIAKAS